MAPRFSTRITECSILPTGDEDPLALVSRRLEASGVRIGKIDPEGGRLVGRVLPRRGTSPCKVTVRLYPREGVSLVEILLEGSPRAWGPEALAQCSDRLRRSLGGGDLPNREATARTRTR